MAKSYDFVLQAVPLEHSGSLDHAVAHAALYIKDISKLTPAQIDKYGGKVLGAIIKHLNG